MLEWPNKNNSRRFVDDAEDLADAGTKDSSHKGCYDDVGRSFEQEIEHQIAMPSTPPGISILRWTFRTIRKVMMASRLATACSKKVKIVIGLFHKRRATEVPAPRARVMRSDSKSLLIPELIWLVMMSRTELVRAMPGTKGMTEPAIIKSSVELKPE